MLYGLKDSFLGRWITVNNQRSNANHHGLATINRQPLEVAKDLFLQHILGAWHTFKHSLVCHGPVLATVHNLFALFLELVQNVLRQDMLLGNPPQHTRRMHLTKPREMTSCSDSQCCLSTA